jgi:hypothetical protein
MTSGGTAGIQWAKNEQAPAKAVRSDNIIGSISRALVALVRDLR